MSDRTEDETEEQVWERQRGRIGKPQPIRSRLVEIIVDGVLLGTLDPDTLTANAQFELEEAQQSIELLDWLERYAGADRAEARRIVGAMQLTALLDLGMSIGTALGEAIKVPKPKRRP